ncbi:MAG TPA: substrate-binding domain-containing protein [Planctomycetota bacterium]|nr:substrate-binding domain-containing protein [Planctomycetota bacterium]
MSPPSEGKRGRPANPDARHRRLAGELRAEIDSGRLPPGAVLPPVRELQARYGVAYRTAWLAVDALRREGRLIRTPGRRLGVLPPGAPSASVQSPILEVVSYSKLAPALANPLGWALHLGVGSGADDANAPLLTVHGNELQKRLPEGFSRITPRGIVLLGHYRREVLRRYETCGVPAVLVDWPIAGWRGHSMCVDNARGAADAVRRFMALGHRHIAFVQRVSLVQGDVELDAKERAAGLVAALRGAGAAPRRPVVFTLSHREEDTSPALERLLTARPAFTAVLTSDDGGAGKVIQAAKAAGRAVPRDLSVACFQPSETARPEGFSGPCVDFEAMAREAVGLLTFPASSPQQRRFPATWNEGSTMAAARPGAFPTGR